MLTDIYVILKSCSKKISLQYIQQKHYSYSNILFIFRFVGGN